MTDPTTTWASAAARLMAGNIGVIPTDTIYGIVGLALKPAIVERIYELRQRDRSKPLIVLLGETADLNRFGLRLSPGVQNVFDKVWPGPVSAIIAADQPELAYLHRGSGGIAFRVPAKPELRALLRQTGPLVAPSANLAGQPSSKTVGEARDYFGDGIFYLDAGPLDAPPSALIDVRTDPVRVLRSAPGFGI